MTDYHFSKLVQGGGDVGYAADGAEGGDGGVVDGLGESGAAVFEDRDFEVADVGFARVLSRDYLSVISGLGTFAWCAPEGESF